MAPNFLTEGLKMVFILSFIILSLIFFLIIKRKEYVYMIESVKQRDNMIDSLFLLIESLSASKKEWKDRVVELEDMKGEAFQVRLRNEIIKIEVGFTKLEIVLILSGVSVLLERTKNPEDAKVYIELIDKINGFIENMKE